MARPRPMRGDQVDGEDRHVGHRGDQPQHEEGAEDRQHPDADREQGGHDAAEDDDEQDQGDRDGDALGPGQVALDGLADLVEDLHRAADLDGHRAAVPRERLVQALAGDLPLVLLAGQAADDEGGRTVLAAQRWRGAERPVGHDVVGLRVGGQLLGQLQADGRDLGRVDVAVVRGRPAGRRWGRRHRTARPGGRRRGPTRTRGPRTRRWPAGRTPRRPGRRPR